MQLLLRQMIIMELVGWLDRNESGRRECCLGCSQFHGDVVYDINAKLRKYTFFECALTLFMDSWLHPCYFFKTSFSCFPTTGEGWFFYEQLSNLSSIALWSIFRCLWESVSIIIIINYSPEAISITRTLVVAINNMKYFIFAFL